ncbi:MAG TPA: M23 family metallopeptidase [Candidatus Dormibacteraeota bacterium]|nr:M23 family metallopeptidase [Candidatus Dormibacteraeota bacterium]
MRKILIAVVAGCLCLIAAPVSAAPATSAPPPVAKATDPLAAALQLQLQQQAALNATVGSLASELQAAQDSQTTLRTLIAANQAAISQTLTQLTTAEQHYSDASTREATEKAAAAAARLQVRSDKALLAQYARLGYETQGDLLSFLLSSSSMSDLFSRAVDLSRLTHRGADLVDQINSDVAEADVAEAKAAADATAAAQAAAQLLQQQQTLQQQTQHAQDLVDQLGAQASATRAEISAANSQSLAVAQQIAQTRLAELDQTIAEAMQAAWQEATYYLQQHLGTLPASITAVPTVPINPDGKQLVWPVNGTAINQPFGPSPYPFEPPFDGFPHFHTGLDLAGPLGTPIVSAAAGVVVAADVSTVGYGNHIIIAHAGGLLTLYGHLETMLVKPGDVVKAGQLIALLGSTGNSTGPHCHFEVRLNGVPVNPVLFLPPLPAGATGP